MKSTSMPGWIKHVPVEHRGTVLSAWRKSAPAVKDEPFASTSTPVLSMLRPPKHPGSNLPRSLRPATTGSVTTSHDIDDDHAKGEDSKTHVKREMPSQLEPKRDAMDSVMDMEARLLGKGTSDATRAKKGRPSKGTAVLKRPSAHAVLKRPAAAVATDISNIKPKIDMKDCFAKMRTAVGLTRNAFCCRAYDTAKRRMKSHGASAANTNIVARHHHAAASRLYDEIA
jgi:hypothetical protein